MVYFSSDFHLQHRAIPKYRTRFETLEEHDEYILSKMEELGKRDILFILGDFLFDGPRYDEIIRRINKMPLRVKLLMGNHDSQKLYNLPRKPGIPGNTIEVQLPFFSYKNMWLSHPPIHPHEMRNRIGNIHGHMHLETLDDPRYFNVNLDVNNYEFVALDTIKEYFGAIDDK